MQYIILTIAFSTLLITIIHSFEKNGVNTFRGIITNYLVCAITGFAIMPNKSILIEMIHWEGFPYSLLLGAMFFFCIYFGGQNS